MSGAPQRMQRVLLLIPSSSYRASAYVEAARRLGVELTVGSDHRQALEGRAGGRSVALPFTPVGEGVARILEFAERHPVHAVVGTDDETIVLAAAAARALKLLHNSPESIVSARDKFRFRQALARGGLRSPWFRRVSLGGDLVALARSIAYPCVLKPLALSASRGVIRADNAGEFAKACTRIGHILRDAEHARIAPSADSILAEGFIPGREVALEGLLERGRLRPLALFDKPDPLDGPFFEETLYVTPSRLPDALQAEVAAEAERAARALGLRDGPVHAELRVNESGAWMIAPETMLEELVLRHALGRSVDDLVLRAGAAGVMMIPIPRAGWLRGIGGIEGARAMAAIEDVVPSIPVGDWVQPLPEGDRYLGFIFARAGTPDEVEAALRAAHARLLIDIEAEAQAARRSPG